MSLQSVDPFKFFDDLPSDLQWKIGRTLGFTSQHDMNFVFHSYKLADSLKVIDSLKQTVKF